MGEGDFGWREREGSVCTQVTAQSMQGTDVQRSVIEVYLVDKDHALYLLYKHCLCAVIFQNGSMHVRILYKYKYLSSLLYLNWIE